MRMTLMTAALLVAATSSPASAATVTVHSGQVQINSGSGFVPVAGSADVSPGSQVMVAPGGAALINYGSCQVKVGAHQIWSVADASPCPQGTDFIDFTQRMGNTSDTTAAPGIDATTVLLGVGVVGGVVAAIALSDDGDNSGNGGGGGSPSLSAE